MFSLGGMEKSLILLKPDCMESKKAGEVIARFENAGFEICAAKLMQLDGPLLKEHYSHLLDKPFFPEIEAFMSSRPVLALVLQGDDAIARIRDLLGPTDSTKAAPGTVRGDLGKNVMHNIAHASDSPEAAKAEIARFFKEAEVLV